MKRQVLVYEVQSNEMVKKFDISGSAFSLGGCCLPMNFGPCKKINFTIRDVRNEGN